MGFYPKFTFQKIEFSSHYAFLKHPVLDKELFYLLPIVRWTREGTKFRDGSYTAIGDLTLPLVNVTMEDGGKYFCTATSSKGNFAGCPTYLVLKSEKKCKFWKKKLFASTFMTFLNGANQSRYEK